MDKFILLHSGYTSVPLVPIATVILTLHFSNFADFSQLQIPNAKMKYYETLITTIEGPKMPLAKLQIDIMNLDITFRHCKKKYRLLLNKGVRNLRLPFHHICLIFSRSKFNICVRWDMVFLEPMHRKKQCYLLIRRRRDYVSGICQYKVLSIKRYFKAKSFERKITGKIWAMYKDTNKDSKSTKSLLHYTKLTHQLSFKTYT